MRMRKLLLVLVGALLLQLGLLQTALADTTPSSKTADPVDTATEPASKASEPDTGVLSRTPAAGPVGTHITVSSEAPCIPPEDAEAPEVYLYLFDPDRPDDDPLADDLLTIDADGAWEAELVVPAGTKAGRYELEAACFPDNDDDSEPYFIYETKRFKVTDTTPIPSPSPTPSPSPEPPAEQPPTEQPPSQQPPSRPATPVLGTPTFTG
jgi:hypothetical protein